MILTRYAVCSERDGKPVTRLICDTRPEAERMFREIKEREADDSESDYWIAEVGPESENWRYLGAVK